MSNQIPQFIPNQQYPSYDFQPSYNAVQLNLKKPTLNVTPEQVQPQQCQQQLSPDAQKTWIA